MIIHKRETSSPNDSLDTGSTLIKKIKSVTNIITLQFENVISNYYLANNFIDSLNSFI